MRGGDFHYFIFVIKIAALPRTHYRLQARVKYFPCIISFNQCWEARLPPPTLQLCKWRLSEIRWPDSHGYAGMETQLVPRDP